MRKGEGRGRGVRGEAREGECGRKGEEERRRGKERDERRKEGEEREEGERRKKKEKREEEGEGRSSRGLVVEAVVEAWDSHN